MNRIKRNRNIGFSLIELIIAIAILIILTGLIVPNVLRYVAQSRRARDIQSSDAAVTAAKVAYIDRNMAGRTADGMYYFDSSSGNAVYLGEDPTVPGIAAYGQSKNELGHTIDNVAVLGEPNDNFVRVTMASDGTVTDIRWMNTVSSQIPADTVGLIAGQNWWGGAASYKAYNYYSDSTGTLFLGNPDPNGSTETHLGDESTWRVGLFTDGKNFKNMIRSNQDVKKLVISEGASLQTDKNGVPQMAAILSPEISNNKDSNFKYASAMALSYLEEVDLTNLPAGTTFVNTVNKNGGFYSDFSTVETMKKITLPTEYSAIPLGTGTWYYYEDGVKKTVATNDNVATGITKPYNSMSQYGSTYTIIDPDLQKELAGKTIYRD